TYLSDRLPVTQAAFGFFADLMDSCHIARDSDDWKLASHIIRCQLSQFREGHSFTPIPKTAIWKYARQSHWPRFADLLDVQPHNRNLRQCREFRFKEPLFGDFVDLLCLADASSELIDLGSAKPVLKISKSRLYDANRHPLPSVIRRAITTYEANGNVF